MTETINPYQPPQAPITEPKVALPRPFPVFLAGAACIGAAVLPLLVALALGRVYVPRMIDGRWLELPARFARDQLLVMSFSTHCGVTLLAAGIAFLKRHGRTGRWFLVATGIGIGVAVPVFSLLADP